MTRPTRLDAAPILRVIEARGGIDGVVGGRTDRDALAFKRMMSKARECGTISVSSADRYCIKILGVNPALIYGEAWWDTIGPPDAKAERWAQGVA